MYVYALVGSFDSKTEELYEKLWSDLNEKNITDYGIITQGKYPHITLADYDNLDMNVFIESLDKYYESKLKIPMSFNILGMFMNTGTLFFAPTMSSELLKLHTEHHEHFKSFNKNENSFYLPGKWVPHCTIASRLTDDTMLKAIHHVRVNYPKIKCQLSKISLIEIELDDNGVTKDSKTIFSKELI